MKTPQKNQTSNVGNANINERKKHQATNPLAVFLNLSSYTLQVLCLTRHRSFSSACHLSFVPSIAYDLNHQASQIEMCAEKYVIKLIKKLLKNNKRTVQNAANNYLSDAAHKKKTF